MSGDKIESIIGNILESHFQTKSEIDYFNLRCKNCQKEWTADLNDKIECCDNPNIVVVTQLNDGSSGEIGIGTFLSMKQESYNAATQIFRIIDTEESDKEKRDLKMDFVKQVREKSIHKATELIVEYILKHNHLYTTKNDQKTETWVYEDGVYVPYGKSHIKEVMREVLGEWFNTFYYNQVLAKIEADSFIDPDKLFKINNPHEIAVQNGILNVRTRQIKPFTSSKIFTAKFPVEYDPSATCPRIDNFLRGVMKDEGDVEVFYEIGGSALVKENKFEKAFMFVGDGRNGKGKTIDLIRRMFGPGNCCAIPLSALLPDSFQISELYGKHVNIAGDIGSQDLKDTQTFKTLTGRDLILAKRKWLPGILFENFSKQIFACNQLPMVYDLSVGFWERWLLIEFPYTFVDQVSYDSATDKKNLKVRDEDILNKITTRTEMSGLLNAFLDGLARLEKNHRFSSSKGTDQIKSMWIRKSNSFVGFCMDCLEQDGEGKIKKKDLRQKYAEYCKKHKVVSRSDFVIKKVLQEEYGASEERIQEFNSWDFHWAGIKWRKNA